MKLYIQLTLFIVLLPWGAQAQDLKSAVNTLEAVEKKIESINNNNQLAAICSKPIIHEMNICEIYTALEQKNIPDEPLRQSLLFYIQNLEKLKNKRYISIADYSKRSDKERFYLIDLETMKVSTHKVSHGSGSRRGGKFGDINHDGYIDKCEHQGSRTNMTRPGFFKTANLYLSRGSKDSHIETLNSKGTVVKGWPYLDESKKSNAMRLVGLSEGINEKALANGVVMHGAWYNNKEVTGSDIMGRSYGCPAFSTTAAKAVLPKIKNGSLFYAYVPKCKEDFKKIKEILPRVNQFCAARK